MGTYYTERDVNSSTDIFNFDEMDLETIVDDIKTALDNLLTQVNGRGIVASTFQANIFREGHGDLRFWTGIQLAP